MARPTKTPIPSGVEGWDEEVNADLDTIFDGPFPVYQSTTSQSLAAFTAALPAAQYDRCLAWHNDSTAGYVLLYSDGTIWRALSKPFVLAGAIVTGNIAVDAAALGDRGTQRTALTANVTYSNPTGGYDGQVITLEPKQHASTGPYTVAFAGKYRFSTTLAVPTMTPTASKRDAYMFKYHAGDDKWDCYAINQEI